MKTPTSSELREFLKYDRGWEPSRDSAHDHYEKVLENGTVLSTHVSWGKKKTVSARTFKLILEKQLAVTEEQFWDTIRLKTPQRTSVVVVEASNDPLTLALRRELMRRLHYTDEQMIDMTGTQAKQLLARFHKRR